MMEMIGGNLIEMLKKNGLKYAVCVSEVNGVPMAMIVLENGQFLGMDQKMLEEVLPMLRNALKRLRKGEVPGGLAQ